MALVFVLFSLTAPLFLRAASAARPDGGRALLGKDANGVWWPVTITAEHIDGTVACVVHDDAKTLWPSVHPSNLMLDDVRPKHTNPSQPSDDVRLKHAPSRTPPHQPPPQQAPPRQLPQIPEQPPPRTTDAVAQGKSETKDSVVLAAVASVQQAWADMCIFCWNFFDSAEDVVDDAGSVPQVPRTLTPPTQQPPTQQPPTHQPKPQRDAKALCKSNPGCQHLGSEGSLCCPTAEGVSLDCCKNLTPTLTPPAAERAQSEWVPVGLERSDIVGSWDFGSGHFSIVAVGNQLHFETVDPNLPGGHGKGAFYMNRALGSKAMPTVRVISGTDDRVAMRIRSIDGDRIQAEVKRDSGSEWALLPAKRIYATPSVQPTVQPMQMPSVKQDPPRVAAQDQALATPPSPALVGRWGYGAGVFTVFADAQGKLHFREEDPLLPRGSASGALFVSAELGLPMARLMGGDGKELGAVQLILRQAPGHADQLGLLRKFQGDATWQTKEILAMRVPAE